MLSNLLARLHGSQRCMPCVTSMCVKTWMSTQAAVLHVFGLEDACICSNLSTMVVAAVSVLH